MDFVSASADVWALSPKIISVAVIDGRAPADVPGGGLEGDGELLVARKLYIHGASEQ